MLPKCNRTRRWLPIVPALAGILLLLVSAPLDPWHHYISLSQDFHVGLWGRFPDARLVFFNDSEYGPYCGSSIGFILPSGETFPNVRILEAFGDRWGIYYRYLRLEQGDLWTWMVSLWYVTGLGFLVSAVWFIRRSLRRRHSTDSQAGGVR
jgi:hypothetical protein